MVKQYIRSCTVCACSKANQHKLYGFLKQLPIPPCPWESISMDVIKQLPTSEGHTAILVIVNCLTKQSLFIPTHDSINSQNLPSCSLPMYSQNIVCHPMSPLTGALSSYPTSSNPSVNYSGWNSTSHLNQVLEQYL